MHETFSGNGNSYNNTTRCEGELICYENSNHGPNSQRQGLRTKPPQIKSSDRTLIIHSVVSDNATYINTSKIRVKVFTTSLSSLNDSQVIHTTIAGTHLCSEPSRAKGHPRSEQCLQLAVFTCISQPRNLASCDRILRWVKLIS